MSPETFEAGWLALREPVDHRSRSVALVDGLRAWWSDRDARRAVDLGCGSGSNLRYLASRLPGPQVWTLFDHDEALLAGISSPSSDVEITTVAADIAATGGARLEHADLVTGSALLDLVSESWIGALVDACARSGSAALFALTYDGTVTWSDSDPTDAVVLEAVNRHQRGDKGFGPALGPDAGRVAEAAFRSRGYQTRLEPSPWVLGAPDTPLVEPLVAGWAEAAGEQIPDDRARLEEWAERRIEAVDSGEVRVTVGHVDLLALPPLPPDRPGP